MHLLYGGGNLGLMGCVSSIVQEIDSQVLGIIPKTLAYKNLIGKSNGEKYIVSCMSERLTEMINHADAFIALPGGFGLLEEIFTVESWVNLNIHQKLIGLLKVDHFFNFLLVFIEDSKRLGFISKPVKDIVIITRRIDELIDQLLVYEPKIDHILSKLN